MLLVGLAAGMIALGIFTLPNMHTDVLPELSQGPVLEVQTESPGLSSAGGRAVHHRPDGEQPPRRGDGGLGRSLAVDPGTGDGRSLLRAGTTTLHARQLVEERLTNSFSLPAVNKPPLLIQPLSTTSRAVMIGLNSSTVESARAVLSRPVDRQAAAVRGSGRGQRRDLRPAGPPDPGPGRSGQAGRRIT